MPPEREPSSPMLKIVEDLGSIKTGLEHVKPKVDAMHDAMVTKEDCRDHREKIEAKLEVTPNLPPNPLERLGKKAGAIAAILTLLGLLGGGLLMLSRIIAHIDASLATERREEKRTRTTLLNELRRPPKPVIVHQPILVYPDAGRRYRRLRRRR